MRKNLATEERERRAEAYRQEAIYAMQDSLGPFRAQLPADIKALDEQITQSASYWRQLQKDCNR